MESKELIVLEERDGHYYILVDNRLILRTTDRPTANHYYKLLTSDKWKGPRLIIPESSSSR